jgi:hypothetical protein
MPGKHKIRLEREPIVATDSCTEFRRHVIVIWKEGRPVVEKEEKEGKSKRYQLLEKNTKLLQTSRKRYRTVEYPVL